jgi:PAS domain S-box-containing protein
MLIERLKKFGRRASNFVIVVGALCFFLVMAMNSGGIDFEMSPQSLKAALLVSLLSIWVLVGLFTFLNRYTKRRYFTIWTVAWLFYAVWLTLNFDFIKVPDSPVMLMLTQWSLGISAVFLLWGSARFLGQEVSERLMGLFLAFLLTWSYIGAYHLENRFAIQVPIFGLIGLASIITAYCFLQYRRRRKFMGAGLLSFGFVLWGCYFVAYPFLQGSEQLIAMAFFISAVLQLFIAVSMIILVLEEVRTANQNAFEQIRAQRSETSVLKSRVTSTEERYRSLFDQASEAIIITDAQLRILEVNQTAQRLLGLTRDEAQQQTLSKFFQTGSIEKTARTGEEWFRWICSQPSLSLVRRNGGATHSEVDGAIIEFEGRPAYQFFFREMTERARLEQQLRQAEKLSALGQMISGVAHELNNPLAVIKGYLELILAHHRLESHTRDDLQKVAQECSRTAKLVRNFLAFAREQPSRRTMVNFNELIERVSELRRFDLRSTGVEIKLELAENLPKTFADADQTQQILLNLITNAIQALEKQPKPRRIKVRTLAKQEVLEVWFEDNGPGVPVELESKIFEPFFTTKPVGTGTGLGLSIAHSIMTDHQGRIFYQKSSIGGAGFVLEYPLVTVANDHSDSTTQEQSQNATSPSQSSASILVLDDEQTIGELLAEMLTMLGHKPVVAMSPLRALELIDQQDFEVILSDFRMPVMNGREFYARVHQGNEALAKRIIFLTGDIIHDETRSFLESTGSPHLAKPFQLSDLEQIIKETLQKHRAAQPTPRFKVPQI